LHQKGRVAGPRLAGWRWRACCIQSTPRTTCEEKISNREEAQALLLVAHGDCLDRAVRLIEKHSKEDLAAAYTIRAQRTGDPVDFLRALNTTYEVDSETALFNRALAQEKLGLTREAIQSWNEVVKHDSSKWATEARTRRDRLMATADPMDRWNRDKLDAAIRRHDYATVRKLAGEFPADAMRYFEVSNVLDLEVSRVIADALAASGEPYARAIVNAAERTADRDALQQGIDAFAQRDYERAAALLERAKNPLHLAARYKIATLAFLDGDPLSVLDTIAPIAAGNGYRDLAGRVATLRANALEQQGRYLEALDAYRQALELAKALPTLKVEALTRRSVNYATIGNPREAFRDSFEALSLLPAVANLNARHHAWGSAAMAARDLGFPRIALQYRDAAVAMLRHALGGAPAGDKRHLAIALRERADTYLELGHDDAAKADLEEASALADAAGSAALRDLLKMRVAEVRGHQVLVKRNSPEAVMRFTEAIALAPEQHSTYRAVLFYKRAIARGTDPRADQDLAAALKILRDEAELLRDSAKRGAYESLWKPYFSRFQAMHHQMIRSRIEQGDEEGAFLYAEQARAFEPMQLVLQAGEVPPGFRKIETKDDLRLVLGSLPDDTIILQYLVLEDHTYTWALSRGRIVLIPQRVGRKQIEQWVERVHLGVEAGQDGLLTTAMRAAYDQLFRVPLNGSHHPRVVIVPDGPMHGLPFAALQDATTGNYLLERSSIAVAGSTSLYLYALHRDRQFSPALVKGSARRRSCNRPPARPQTASECRRGSETARPRLRGLRAPARRRGDDGAVSRLGERCRDHPLRRPRTRECAEPVALDARAHPHGKDAGDLTAENS
jgi:tetratricopeptide (TPR) repeat protein